jgi:hypothetical protein
VLAYTIHDLALEVLSSRVAVAVAVVSRGRHVEGRVGVEESGRLEREPCVGDGRHRPVFGANERFGKELP